MDTLKIAFTPITRQGRRPILPAYQTEGAAAADLHAFLEADMVLAPGARGLIPTGLCLAIPRGFGGLVLARSGLAAKQGLTMANGVGLIDSDFRGEVLVALANLGREPCVIRDGDRVAQLMLVPAPAFCLLEAEALPQTARGDRGFGSTGRGGSRI